MIRPITHELPWLPHKQFLNHFKELLRVEFDHLDAIVFNSQKVSNRMDVSSVLRRLKLIAVIDRANLLSFKQEFNDP